MEGAGIVSEVGYNLALSRRVMKSCLEVGGMGRLRKKCSARIYAFTETKSFSFEEVAAFKTVYLTAFVGLIRRGNLVEGENLLVHGATGGVGGCCRTWKTLRCTSNSYWNFR